MASISMEIKRVTKNRQSVSTWQSWNATSTKKRNGWRRSICRYIKQTRQILVPYTNKYSLCLSSSTLLKTCCSQACVACNPLIFPSSIEDLRSSFTLTKTVILSLTRRSRRFNLVWINLKPKRSRRQCQGLAFETLLQQYPRL